MESAGNVSATNGVPVLVIDDDVFNLRLTADLLSARGLNVQTAESGFEALSLVSTQIFSVMLVDFILPDMTGRQFYDLVRTVLNTGNREKPVVFLTGEDEIDASVSLSASAVIVKPYTESTLFRTLAPFVGNGKNGKPWEVESATRLKSFVPDFSRLFLITDGSADRLERFFAVYLEQFEELIHVLNAANDASSLPELRTVHHRASTAINLLQLHELDAELRKFREEIRYGHGSAYETRLGLIQGIDLIKERILHHRSVVLR